MLKKGLKYLSEYGKRRAYQALYKRIIDANPEYGKPAEGEQEWLTKWRRYDKQLKPYAYRIFSRCIGNDMNIAPLETVQNVVESVLTPVMMSEYYSDKNTVGKVLSKGLYDRCVPKIYLRNMAGFYYDEEYNPMPITRVQDSLLFLESDRVILKPSRESSGNGVQVFHSTSEGFKNKTGDSLTVEYLKQHYKQDFLIQECLSQSASLSMLNPTSVNTIRLATYRDEHGLIHPLHTSLRIGASGAEVDNAHAGGRFCSVSESGVLGKCLFDTLGRKYFDFNGIDFSKETMLIPNFSEVIELAKEIAAEIPHHDLLAFDIALNDKNRPMLIEYNTYGFGAWIFQFACGPVFGVYTEEIMERCVRLNNTLGGRIIVTSVE